MEEVIIRIKAFEELTVGEFFAAARLRQAVFYLEQKITCEDLDPIDPRSLTLWAEAGPEVVGVLRILPPGVACDEASVGRVAVAPPYRHRGVARKMMAAALEYIARRWHAPVLISAQQYIIPFYEELGFEVVSEPFFEAGIPHRKMIRRHLE